MVLCIKCVTCGRRSCAKKLLQLLIIIIMMWHRILRTNDIHTSRLLNMFNDFETANRFVECWPFITQCQSVLARQTKLCQESIIEALFVFLESDKTLLKHHTPNIRGFFLYATQLRCNCVSNKMLLIHLSLKWYEWFYFCARKLREMIPH